MAQQNYSSALLLVDSERNAVIDRRALRDAGINQVRVLTSGVQAARLLAGHNTDEPDYTPDVIFCHQKMIDMDGLQLAELLRTHPQLLLLPLIMIAGNNDEATRMDALASGFSAWLARPYSQQDVLTVLQQCALTTNAALHAAKDKLDTGAFDAALDQYSLTLIADEKPEVAFKMGLQFLQQRQWDAAITAFQRAVRLTALKGEAEMGLAAAWYGKGDLARYHYYLNEASNTFARATMWHKARVAYARLLRHMPDAPNPFLAVTENMIRTERFDDAAEALAAGYDLGPMEDTPRRLAKACLFTSDPPMSVSRMRTSLANTSMADNAESMGEEMEKALEEQSLLVQARTNALRIRDDVQALDGHSTPCPYESQEEYDLPALTLEPTDNVGTRRAVSVLGRISPLGTKATKKTAPAKKPVPEHTPSHTTETLPPLHEENAASTLFTNMPKVNEVLTVMKVTWQLLRNSK